jgi:hypothetical protein
LPRTPGATRATSFRWASAFRARVHTFTTGDAPFDDRYSSRGTDAAVTTWLTPPVRKLLLAIAHVDPAHLEIAKGAAILRYSFGIEDPRPLRQAIKLLSLLADTDVKIPQLVRKR